MTGFESTTLPQSPIAASEDFDANFSPQTAYLISNPMKTEYVMNRSYRLSNVTKDYLSEFHCILDTMIKEMTSAELSDSISHNFIIQMIPHHEAAIRMSENLLKYTTFIPLQDIALQIISEQTKSIADMQKAECVCRKLINSDQDICLYERRTDQIMNHMFGEMETACSDNNVNGNFMREMIPHHRGAVEMSENTLQYNICPELVPILEAIITSQKRGIVQMQQLLRCIRE